MDRTHPIPLPPALQRATDLVRTAARSAAALTVDSLGLAAMASTAPAARDALLDAQQVLRRSLGEFQAGFDAALQTEVARAAGLLSLVVPPASTNPSPDELVARWDRLSLVSDDEVELHLSADRFARSTAQACEWELRELEGYLAAALQDSLPELCAARVNPLRPEGVGQALVRALEPLSPRPEVRKALCSELGRSLSTRLRGAYAALVTELRDSGLRPLGPVLKPSAPRTTAATGPARDGGRDSAHGAAPPDAERASTPGHEAGFAGAGRATGHGWGPGSARGDERLGEVDSDVMALLRQLATQALHALPAVLLEGEGSDAGAPGGGFSARHDFGRTPDGAQRLAPNLIDLHRDTLHRATAGSVDPRVIDVVAGLFDAVLSDGRVPAPIARALARLQMPVLRAAVGDPGFFTRRAHPVRRFINRIATLGSAIDDLDAPAGRALLQRVNELVSQVAQGAFDQAAPYERALGLLDSFVAAQAHAEVSANGRADRLLAHKEGQLRVQQRFAEAVDEALQDVPVPEYLRVFVRDTWSRVIAQAEQTAATAPPAEAAAATTMADTLRDTGRELLMSVQPKGSTALRQAFVRELPGLMRALQQGLDRIRCPEPLRQAFFAQLLPAHAEALKRLPLSTLEHNLLARKVSSALATPLPRLSELPAHGPLATPEALDESAVASVFTPAEAAAVGLVPDQAVDWQGRLDIDLSDGPELAALDIDLGLGGGPPEAPEPTRGAALAEHVQIGFAYRMQLQGRWQKVRLTHVSPGRGFFVFSHGDGGRRQVSLTARMLRRLCEAGRLRAFENAYLLERAAARARQQLATLLPAGAHPARA